MVKRLVVGMSGASGAPLMPTISRLTMEPSLRVQLQEGARWKRSFKWKGTVQSKMVLQDTPTSGMDGE